MLVWKRGWRWGWKVFSSFSHPPPPLPHLRFPERWLSPLGWSGAVVQTFYVGQYSVLVSLYPLPTLTPPPIITKSETLTHFNPPATKQHLSPPQCLKFLFQPKSASPHMKRVPDRSEQGFSTNCGNLGISSKRWHTSWEFLFPHLPASRGGRHCPLAERASMDHSPAPGVRRGDLSIGREKAGRGPGRESAPLGISCGPVSPPFLPSV